MRSRDAAVTDKTPLLGRLIQEAQLSSRATQIAPYLQMNGMTLETCLIRARINVAGAAYDAAFETSWERRTVFARTLRLARAYLEFILEADEIAGREHNALLTARLGIATILTARFALVSEEELQAACATLLEAHDGMNEHVLTYFLEGCLWLYDAFDLRESLQLAARTINKHDASTSPMNISWVLNSAAVWSKLASCASSYPAQNSFLDKALNTLHRVDPESIGHVIDRLAFEMQDAYLSALRDRTSSSLRELGCSGVRFPFALRTTHIDLPSEFYAFGDEIAGRLRASASAGSYLYRDVTAELLSYMARDGRSSSAKAVKLVTEAISLRRGLGNQRQLKGRRVGLAQAEDQLFLAELASNPQARMLGLLFLASDADTNAESATRLSVLARDIENHGPYIGALLPVESELALLIRNGDSRALYERAARAATQSHDLARIALGGRGGVIALRDSATRIGQTFVYKVSREIALERDRLATESITQAITDAGLSERFGVIEHLSTMSPEAAGLVDTSPDAVVSVRRFRNGRTLHAVIMAGELGTRRLVIRTITFLALIHANPSYSDEVSGVRRSIWETEMGRWLRSISVGEERSEFFRQWWQCLESAPTLPRRDAHAMNWLVEGDARIVAVDLESIGWRPFGYELAQLLEDTPVFDVHDWSSRATCLRTYVEDLTLFGVELKYSEQELLEFYAAGVLARAVRTLSSPLLDSQSRAHGGELLVSVAREFTGSAVGALANHLVRAWAKRTGMASDDELVPLVDAERRRISRAMSFHLRHNEKAPVTKDGWIHAEELADLLTVNGHKVTAPQLLLIAGALGEPRFELDGDEIRSSYGHSTTKAALKYEARRPPETLFHATPLRNLPSILEAQDGIRKGQRQWVHMTDSVDVALSASRRQRQPVVVLAIDARNLDGVVFASGHTWLAKRVSNDDLRILTISETTDLLLKEKDPARNS